MSGLHYTSHFNDRLRYMIVYLMNCSLPTHEKCSANSTYHISVFSEHIIYFYMTK